TCVLSPAIYFVFILLGLGFLSPLTSTKIAHGGLVVPFGLLLSPYEPQWPLQSIIAEPGLFKSGFCSAPLTAAIHAVAPFPSCNFKGVSPSSWNSNLIPSSV